MQDSDDARDWLTEAEVRRYFESAAETIEITDETVMRLFEQVPWDTAAGQRVVHASAFGVWITLALSEALFSLRVHRACTDFAAAVAQVFDRPGARRPGDTLRTLTQRGIASEDELLRLWDDVTGSLPMAALAELREADDADPSADR